MLGAELRVGATGQGREHVDMLREVMAGFDEPAATIERPMHPIAERIIKQAGLDAGYEAINEFLGHMEKIATAETEAGKKDKLMHIWTEAILLAGEYRDVTGVR